jgi:hypothetical protein
MFWLIVAVVVVAGTTAAWSLSGRARVMTTSDH